MAMDIQEISDRLEINNLLIDYCSAVDAKTFADFDRIFTAEAVIDYTALGGIRGSVAEIKEYLGRVMPHFGATQHLIANSRVWVEGDTARARTMCHNPMEIPLPAFPLAHASLTVQFTNTALRSMPSPPQERTEPLRMWMLCRPPSVTDTPSKLPDPPVRSNPLRSSVTPLVVIAMPCLPATPVMLSLIHI